MESRLTYLEARSDAPTAVSLKITVAPSDTRTPSHFIALLDVSESMDECEKLKHAKHCMRLLLNFMTPQDEISVVTFGDDSQILLNRVKTIETEIPRIQRAIESIRTNGCTNLSGGLGAVREVLEGCRDSPLKPGLLLLTDGHANRAAFTPRELTGIVKHLAEVFPTLSWSFLAYGTDHNAELLKTLADETRGSYSIVENLENAALAAGTALGGIISCVAQNVVVEVPPGTTVEGPYKLKNNCIVLGDLYADSKMFLLLKKGVGQCFLRGVALPLLDPFRVAIVDECDSLERNAEVDLTRLRYSCVELFHAIRRTDMVGSPRRQILSDIADLKEKLTDPFLAGNPLTEMLKGEVASMEAAIEQIDDNGGATPGVLYAHLAQHEAYTSSGGGVTNTIRRRPATTHVRWEDDDPPMESSAVPAAQDAQEQGIQSPMLPGVQRSIASAMRGMSQER
jgi:Mg-chelatase subunit ChlD